MVDLYKPDSWIVLAELDCTYVLNLYVINSEELTRYHEITPDWSVARML